MTSSPHIAILGAGPGGYVAAIRAAQLGARVTVIEREKLGGVCLNWGCIPSKALLSVVELGDKLKKAEDLGLILQAPATYDLARMVARKEKVVATLVKGIATLFKGWGIEQVTGQGVVKDARTLAVTLPDGAQREIHADAIVIATGSSWPNLPQFPIDGRQIVTSQQILDLTQVPASLAILGGGVEGASSPRCTAVLGRRLLSWS
ncbi:MAG: FAD-dependent oxidoreductase [Nitrospira sp.]|nr:FAD-dependent oxidoreductase [Nitrospira sp.]